MKLYTYYAEDDDFCNIIDDIIEASKYSDEPIYDNLEIEEEDGTRVFAIENDNNLIVFDYNFFISFMKDYVDRAIENYLDNNPITRTKED